MVFWKTSVKNTDLKLKFSMEIEHSVINKNNFAEARHFWESYPNLDVLCLAFIFAIYSMEMQKVSVLVLKTVYQRLH